MNIPDTMKNVDVVVALAIPLPTQSGGLNFPLVEGKITETFDTSFVIHTTKGEDMLLPHNRVQHVMRASKIERAGSGILMPRA